MNKKVYLCDIEALREGTNDKYGVSVTLVFNKGLTYKELAQVFDEKYFYLSNNNLQNRINRVTKEIKELYEIAKEQDSDNVNLIDRLELILKILNGEDNE